MDQWQLAGSDVPMQDADRYTKAQHHPPRPHPQYQTSMGASTRQLSYSPMDTLSPSSPYAAGLRQPTQNPVLHSSQTAYTRQSPTRPDSISSQAQGYYASPCTFSERILPALGLRSSGADAYSAPDVASYQAPPQALAIQSPPSNGNRSHPATAPAQLSAGFAQELRSPRQPHSHPNYLRPRGPIPRFRRLHSTDDLDPKINAQPPFRRANPEGGFISVSFLAPTAQRDGEILISKGSRCNH